MSFCPKRTYGSSEIVDPVPERMLKVDGAKKRFILEGRYTMEFVTSVLGELSAGDDGLSEDNVRATFGRRAAGWGVKLERENVAGKPLNLVGMNGISSIADFYRGLGKVRPYSADELAAIVQRKAQRYASGNV